MDKCNIIKKKSNQPTATFNPSYKKQFNAFPSTLFWDYIYKMRKNSIPLLKMIWKIRNPLQNYDMIGFFSAILLLTSDALCVYVR